MKKNLIKLLILLFIGLTFYFSRQIFFYKYEPEYYENWYYHSQWNIPNSVRGIGDGDLYKFVGYRLAFGENPFNINYEVPPFAKLLYGLAERYLSNPYIISIAFYLLSIILLYQTSRIFFPKNKYLSLLTTLLFASSPFISTQIKETMLDLPLMFFFNLHLFYFLHYLNRGTIKHLVLAGFFLGIATGCKIGIYSPFVFLIGLIFIFIGQKEKIKKFFLYGVSTFTGYCFSFISYFVHHPNPIPWLRLHQKPLNFYLGQQNSSQIDHFNQLKGILFNRYQGFWEGAQLGKLGDWSPMLTIALLILIPLTITAIKKKDHPKIYLCLFSLPFLLVNCFIPFFPRYLMPIIPIFCLLITLSAQSKPIIIWLIILLNIPFYYNSVAKEPYQDDFDSTVRFINTRNYRELYRAIDPNQRQTLDENYFIDSYENFLNQIGTRKIESNITDLIQNKNTVTGKLQLTYQTRYGNLENTSDITLKKIHNQWKLVWDWDFLFKDYQPEYQINIIPKTNKTTTEAFMVPRLMFDWGRDLTKIKSIIHIEDPIIDERLKFTVPDKYPRWIGDISQIPNPDPQIPGLQFSQYHYQSKIFFINNKNNQINIIE